MHSDTQQVKHFESFALMSVNFRAESELAEIDPSLNAGQRGRERE